MFHFSVFVACSWKFSFALSDLPFALPSCGLKLCPEDAGVSVGLSCFFIPVSPPFLFLFHTNRPAAREGVVIRPMGLLGTWFHPRSLTQMPGMDTSFYLALLLVSAINPNYPCFRSLLHPLCSLTLEPQFGLPRPPWSALDICPCLSISPLTHSASAFCGTLPRSE